MNLRKRGRTSGRNLAKILLTAAPYGFGPTAKLVCLAQVLAGRHELIYVGGSPGLELATSADFDDILEFGDRDAWSENAATALKSADLLVSVHEARALYLGSGVPDRTLFLDTLLWARRMPLPNNRLPTAYVAQRFLKPLNLSVHLTKHIRQIGAILPPSTQTFGALSNKNHAAPIDRDPQRVLVNMGGLQSPLTLDGAEISYIRAMTRLIAHTRVSDGPLDICLPKHLARHLATLQAECPAARFMMPSHHEFQNLLSACSLLITVPGLESVLEALANNVPLIFLPAHNGTQFLQYKAYKDCSLGLMHMEDYLPPPVALDLTGLSLRVQLRNGDLLQTASIILSLSERLDFLLENSSKALQRKNVAHGRELLESIGGDGLTELESVVEELLI